MWKRFSVLMITLIGICVAGYASFQMELNATSSTTYAGAAAQFPSIQLSSYMKLQLSTNEIYTSLNTSGKFLADQSSTSTPVDHTTTITSIVDTRNSSFIQSTAIPSLSDIQPDISNNVLNSQIPSTDAWWLSDTAQVNAIASARIVNANNKLNEEDYVVKSATDKKMKIWSGYYPIENKTLVKERISSLYSSTDIYAPFRTITTEKIKSYEKANHSSTYDLCDVIYKDGVIQPCDADNPSKPHEWPGNYGYALQKVTLDPATKKLNVVDPSEAGGKDLHAGDLVIVGELRWPIGIQNNIPPTSNGYPQTGYGLKVVGVDATITDTVGPKWGEVNENYFMGDYYEDLQINKQQALLRPLLTLDTSQIVYVSEQGKAISSNAYEPLPSGQAGKTYIAHILDSNLTFNGIGTIQDAKISYDAATNTIRIPKGTTSFSLPITMSATNSGYDRYVSALGKNTSGGTVFGQIGKVSNTNSVSFDVSSFLDTNTVGSKNSITLYIEDIHADKTNYISQGFPITLEVYGELEISYKSIYGGNLDYYNSGINVNGQDKIGELTYAYGISPRTFEIIQDPAYPNDTTYQNFTLEGLGANGEEQAGTSSPLSVSIKSNATDLLPKTNGLRPGVYHFGIKALDANKNPIDASGNPTAVHYETLVVYPHDTQITYTQNKNGTEYYSLQDINANNYDLGSIQFDNDANIKELNEKGYTIKHVQLVEKGTTTPLTMLEAVLDSSDPTLSTYLVKKKGNVSAGNKEFDILITFENASKITAQIRKENQIFIIPNTLSFVDQKSAAFLTKSEYDVLFDPVTSSNNTYYLWATDNSDPAIKNNAVSYCVLDSTTKECDTSSTSDAVIKLHPSTGQMSFEAKGPGTKTQNVTIRAYIKDASGTYLSKCDLKINVHPAIQKLQWKGTDIQSSGNQVTQASGAEILNSHPTWKIALKYDSVTTSNNVISFDAFYDKDSVSAGSLGLFSNVNGSGGTPPLDIAYTLELSPADAGKITLDSTNKTFTLHGELINDARIVATAKGTGNYADTINSDDVTTSNVNEDGSATLLVKVSSKPSLKFTPSTDLNDYKASVNSDMAKGNASFGKLSLDPTGESITGYDITKVELYGKAASEAAGSDVWNTVPIASTFKIAGANNDEVWSNGILPAGKYRIIVVAKNGTNEVSNPKTITFTIEKEKFDITKLKWQKKLKEDTSFSDVGGSIKESDLTNTKAVEDSYRKNGTLQVELTEKTTGYLSGAVITYDVKDADSALGIQVDTDGKVTMKKAQTSYIKAHITKNGFEDMDVYLAITVGKGNIEFYFSDAVGDELSLNGNILTKNDSGLYQTYTTVYKKNQLLPIFTSGAPSGSEVTIKIISEVTPTASHTEVNDVLKFDDSDANVTSNSDTTDKICTIPASDYNSTHLSACQTMIQNALLNKNDVIKIVATTSETADYASQTITLPVKITKADQPDFAFKQEEYRVLPDKNGSFSPVFVKKESTGKIQLSLIPSGGSSDLAADKAGVKAGNNEQFVNKKDTVWYNIPLSEGDEPVSFHVYAKDLGDRNYNASDEVSMLIIVDPESGSTYDITLESTKADSTTSPLVTYGDEYFTIDAYSPKDDTELNFSYTYELVDDAESYIEKVTGETNKFKPIKAGENVRVKITRTNNDTGVVEPSMIYTFTVFKKNIQVTVSDIHKLQGEKVEKSEYAFHTTPDFLAADALLIGNADFSCKRGNVDVTTLSYVEIQDNGLSIQAVFKQTAQNKEVLKNYDIQIQTGTLHVNAQESNASWYEVVGGEKDGTTSKKGEDDWYNGIVDVRLIAGASADYDLIGSSIEQPFDPVKFTVSAEGNNQVDVYFRQSSGAQIGAISTPQKTNIKIDSTKPRIEEITGVPVERNGLKDLIHKLSGGIFFKPNVKVEIQAKDVFPGNDESIEISGLKEISYKVYEVSDNGDISTSVFKEDSVSAKGDISFTLPKSGKYYVETKAIDKAGNESDILGSFINVKKIDVDEDDDGEPDFNDSNEDGCPDLNIILGEDSKGNKVKLNVAEKGKKYPYMNIDSDGDGIADLNIDTDHDGKPDLNLVIMDASMWKPNVCVPVEKLKDYTQPNEYCTGTSAKSEINVDTDGDGIPDINIDNDGDFKPDLNISNNGKDPQVNIVKLHEWKPKHDYTKDTFFYDSIGMDKDDPKREVNIDTDGDGRPDVNIDLDKDGKPDLNIDMDGDEIPDIDIDSKGDTEGSPPDGKPDVNVDTNGDGKPDKNVIEIKEWIPKKDVDGKIPYDTMEITGKKELEDNGVIVEKPDGNFLPNTAIKVKDVSDTIDTSIKEKIDTIAGEQEIKKVYDVEYLENNVTKQPNGSVKVKIPVDPLVKNAKVVVEKEDGTFEEISVTEKDGYYVFETEYIGKVSIIGDVEETKEPTPEPKPTPTPEPTDKTNPSTSVQGSYTKDTSGVGGAYTGDTTNTLFYILGIGMSLGMLFFTTYKRRSKE